MKCPNCQTENPPDSRFCNTCAARLPSSEEISSTPTRTIDKSYKEFSRGTIFADRYEFVEELGRGGMGTVYKVYDKKVQEEIALKLLNPDIGSDEKTIERFRNELRLARKIVHKNVCQMYDLNEADEKYFITMEFVSGENLKRFIKMAGHLSSGKSISIAKQICEGLTEAHRLGVIHRDLKPQNVMVDREGNARIMDFGVARLLKAEGLTGPKGVVGTPEYMSPEQVDGKKADERADIYALGVILYEMVTGRPAFKGSTPLSTALKHKTEPPPDPREIDPKIPEELSEVILRCMEKDRDQRYQDTKQLLSELTHVEEEISTAEMEIPGKKGVLRKPSRKPNKKSLLYAISTLVAIALIVAGILLLFPSGGVIDSIAVLPFEIAGADPNTEYLSDGITESIIGKLTQIPSLKKVIARSSVFRYKGTEYDPQDAGRELGVDAVLVSQMSRRRDELSISVELMRVRDRGRIWGKQYTSQISEIFDVQEEITNSIVDNLRLRLTAEERARIRVRYTENPAAFTAFSRGQYFWNKRTLADLERAIPYFEEAIRIDPDYAKAYAGLANTYLLLPEYGNYRPKDAYPRVRELANKAIELDEMLAEAHTTLAQIKRRFEYNWAASEREYLLAIEFDPNFATAHHWYGYDLMCMGRFDEAIREIRRAQELDPRSLVINRNVGQVLYRAGRYEEAMEALEKTLEMEPNFSNAHLYIGNIHLENGRYEEALQEFLIEKENAKGWGMRTSAWIGVAYAKLGREEKTREVLDELLEKSQEMYISPTSLAMLYFVLEEDEMGFQMLEKAYEEYDTWLRLVKVDPVFARVRPDSRFQEVLRKIGLSE